MSLASNHATNAYCTDVVAEMKKAIRGASNADGSTTAAARHGTRLKVTPSVSFALIVSFIIVIVVVVEVKVVVLIMSGFSSMST